MPMHKPIISLFCATLLLGTPALLGANEYRVTGVESWDTLNLRSAPGVKSTVLARLPADAQDITRTGKHTTVGKTVWQEINWQGKTGWVSKRYLAVQPAAQAAAPEKPVPAVPEQAPAKPAPLNPAPVAGGVREKTAGDWILECGSAAPYWKVEVLPKWMNIYIPEGEGSVPLQHKKQTHSKVSKAALKTEVRGAQAPYWLAMTLTYSGNCSSSLMKRRVPFNVKGELNGEPISGCCRSVQVK